MDFRVQAFFLFYHIPVICPEKIRGKIAGKDMKQYEKVGRMFKNGDKQRAA